MQNPTLSPGYWVRLVRYIAKNIARGESFEQQILQIPPTYSLAGQTAFFPFYIGSGKKGSGDTPLANLFCISKLFWNSN